MSFSNNKLPSLKGLRAVESVTRLGSFTAAADELCVTQGAISRLVRTVEQDLGVRLFDRSGPKFKTTEAGERYANALGEAFQIMGAATRSLQQKGVSDILTVSMLPSFATKWFTPQLGEFLSLCPEAELRISVSQALSKFDDGVDVAIRYGRGNWPGTQSIKLMEETIFPVCSPDFISRHGPLSTIRDLESKTLLQGNAPDRWSDWLSFAASSEVDLDPNAGTFFNDGVALYQAAINGHGVALGRSVLVAQDLSDGRLIAPFRQRLLSKHAYYLVWPNGQPEPKHLDRFKRWLISKTETGREM